MKIIFKLFMITVILSACMNKNVMQEDTVLIKKGMEAVKSSQLVLSSNLSKQIRAAGPLGALNFCNIKASHFTDSLSKALGLKISRVSDKTRNKNKGANATQLTYIMESKEKLEKGEEIEPQLVSVSSGKEAYYPIFTNSTCLKCHGAAEVLDSALTEKLNQLYPEDKAKGYSENELRGIWVVEFLDSLIIY